MTLGLGNMRALLAELGHPENKLRSVVVAGTNGKGSVTAYLSALLGANGQRVGCYSSPHVYSVNERICVDNEPVSVEEMEEAAARIVPLYGRVGFSYFEALTAIAFLIFAGRDLDLCVLETGLGGRFDATNVVDPVVTVITGVSLDHRRILGDTEEEILREKLGIARAGTPLVLGRLAPALQEIVAARAERERIPLRRFDDLGRVDVADMTFDGMRARLRTRKRDYGTVPLPLVGEHQAANALVAVAAAEYLVEDVAHFERAAATTRLPGRFEARTVAGKTVILDVAHNDEALLASAKTMAALSAPVENAMVLGMLQRKELRRFPARLPRYSRRLYLVDPVPGESLEAPALLERIGLANLRGKGVDVFVETRFESGAHWMRFLGQLFGSPQRVILIAGSFRTVEVFGRRLQDREWV
ncbi:MAG: bifunctional folylpolyglutamate synthase/dihydrofolate synthase [Candidatus Krumholzibacteriia bacterium]